MWRRATQNADRELELMKANKKLEVMVAGQTKRLDELSTGRDELAGDKDRLKKQVETQAIELQTFLDEHLALQLAYNRSENDLKTVKAENDELLTRWLQLKQEEADKQNATNEQVMQ